EFTKVVGLNMMDSLFKSIEELAGANVPVRAFESDNANLVQTCRVSRRSRFKPRPPNALAGIYAASRHVAPEPLIDRVHRPHQSPVVFVLRTPPQTPRTLLRQLQRTERHARLANFVSRVKFEMVSQISRGKQNWQGGRDAQFVGAGGEG